MYSVFECRKYLDQHLDKFTVEDSIKVCEDYKLDLEIIRQYRDYLDWEVLKDYDVIIGQVDDDNFLNAMREFKDEIEWEEGGFKRWYQELKYKVK